MHFMFSPCIWDVCFEHSVSIVANKSYSAALLAGLAGLASLN